MTFIQGINPPDNIQEPRWFFLFKNRRLLVQNSKNIISIPREYDISTLSIKLESEQYPGTLDGVHCFSGTTENFKAPAQRFFSFNGP